MQEASKDLDVGKCNRGRSYICVDEVGYSFSLFSYPSRNLLPICVYVFIPGPKRQRKKCGWIKRQRHILAVYHSC